MASKRRRSHDSSVGAEPDHSGEVEIIMATILVVDDRQAHRDFLFRLLGDSGHELREADDGAEALDIVRRDTPELVITDVELPTMDCDEFVRQMRSDPRSGATPLIFSTVAAHEGEARAAAERWGVTHLLAWPFDAAEVLRAVAEVMGTAWSARSAASPLEVEREELCRRNGELAEKIRALEAMNRRLVALGDLAHSVALERNPHRLLALYCRAGLELLGSRRAMLVVVDEDGETFRYVVDAGEDVESPDLMTHSPVAEGLPGLVALGGVPTRAVAAEGQPLVVFPGLPPATSCLGVPVATARRRYGVLTFIDKEGATGFDADDEALAVNLSTQIAIAYEGLMREAELARGSARIERYAEQLAILRRIDRAVLSTERPTEIASVVVRHLRQFLGCWSVGVWVFDWETSMAERLAAAGATEPLLPAGMRVSIESLGVEDLQALISGQDRIVADVSLLSDPARTIRMLRAAGLRSYVRMPLAFEGQLIGTLVLSSDRTGIPESEKLELAHQVADQLAIAMRHALLFHRVRAGGERMRTLSHQLIRAQEAERRRIARELHDEIGQSLTAAKINLQAAIGDPSTGPSSTRLRESIGLIDRVLGQVRNISLDLRPSVLDDLGLAASIRSHLDRTSRCAGFVGSFAADPPEIRLTADIETECFRVAQEALTNVVRHAGARRVEVVLSRRDESLELIVRDDGAGFDVAAARQRAARGGSLGLLGMQERSALLGGRITIDSTPGHGTKVQLSVPLAEGGSSRKPRDEEESR
jgi:signal transduction histidine kinase/CheY-like chemotaxis protein